MKKKIISIITPVYNEEFNVEACLDAIRALFSGPLSNYGYEHIFADNASTDRTVELLTSAAAEDRRVKIIVNARNYGPSRSAFNAIKRATGDAVVALFPIDLQDPAEVIVKFVKKWEEGFEVVYGIREQRDEGFILTGVRRNYYRMVTKLSHTDIPPNVGDFQLIDRKVLSALKQFDDYYPYIRGIIANCGFRSTGVSYHWVARQKGVSSNTFLSLIDQGLNGLISLSNVPLRLSLLIGLIIAGASILYALVLFVLNIIYYRETSEPGIATLTVGLFFFSGVQLFFIGVIGEYVGAIHGQVRSGPRVIERQRINFDNNGEETPPRQ